MCRTWLALVISSTPPRAAAAPGLPGSSSRSGNHEHTAMAEAASLCPGASPHVCSLTALCRDSASSLPWGLGASSHREQPLLQNKCPAAWEPPGAKGLGGRAPPGVAPWFPQLDALQLLLPWRTAFLLPGHPRLVSLLHRQCSRPCHAPGTAPAPDPWGSQRWQRRGAVKPQRQWQEGEVQLILLQGLGTVGLTLSWIPPLLPYRLISNPLSPMAGEAAEPFKGVSSWG